MKSKKAFIIILFLLGLFDPRVFAQDISTQGTEFWVSYMGNGFKTRYDLFGQPEFTWLRIQLIVSAKRDCNCTIKNPNTNYEQSFHVNANSTFLFDNIPWEEAYLELDEHGQSLSKALRITSDDTISVYCSNIAEVSFDASYILPTPALGDDYIIQTYNQSTSSNNSYGRYYTSAFVIVATEEGETTIDITPSVNTLDNHNAGTEYSITLRQGEAYQVRSHNSYSSRDLSGTRVTARDCKKIAVFNGNNLTMVPSDGGDSDCIFEQAMPLTAWGKRFVVTASLGREKNDVVKITSAHDNNAILRNGTLLATLNTGESTTFELRQSDKSCFIEASQSCAVYLYNHSKDNDGWPQNGAGAPSMVWIAPIEQRINDITFSTFNYVSEHDTDIDDHYVNIIVSADDIQHVYFDNELLPASDFEAVNGTSEYYFARKRIEHDSHHMSCANGFNAHVYGFGYARGYAYLVGSNAKDLSTKLTINNEVIMPNETFPYCSDQDVTFQVDVNLSQYTLLWDFGDGTTSTQNPATHTYQDKRVYEALLYIDTDAVGCTTSGESDTLVFYVDATQQYITESEEACAGQLYSGHGFNNVLINNDTILARLQDNPIHPECKDSLLVYITTHQQYHVPISDSRCWHGEPSVYDDNGFSFVYDSPGFFEHTLELQTEEGCDSIIFLQLTVSEMIHTEFDTVLCGTFYWDGEAYNTSGSYSHYYTAIDGCDSVATCHLNIHGHIYGDTTNVTRCDRYEWHGTTYTQTGTYSYVYPSALGCDSTVFLDLHIDYSPHPTPIYPADTSNQFPHWVINASEFQINSYEFTLHDSIHDNERFWNSIRWEFENPEIPWILDPDATTTPPGMKCWMYVLNHVEDTVWIRATIYNDCNPEGESRRYWFVCSFYGIDEDDPSTSSGAFDFSVMPNPNNGTMNLVFSRAEGRTDIKVYDMRGIMIDQLQVSNAMDGHTMTYEMKDKADGIYFLIATNKEGMVAKKVIIKQ